MWGRVGSSHQQRPSESATPQRLTAMSDASWTASGSYHNLNTSTATGASTQYSVAHPSEAAAEEEEDDVQMGQAEAEAEAEAELAEAEAELAELEAEAEAEAVAAAAAAAEAKSTGLVVDELSVGGGHVLCRCRATRGGSLKGFIGGSR